MVMGFVHNLSPYVSCIGQAACRAFEKGNAMGSGTAKFKDACRDRGVPNAFGIVLWLRKTPHMLLLEVATSLSFRYPVVMPFAGFL
jgi:hypothetical protein